MTEQLEQSFSDAAPRPEPPLADERTEFLSVNGLRLLCRHWGEPDAPALVLLHGLRGFSGTWRRLAGKLSADYHLVALDQRGRGDSDWDREQNYYTDSYLADLEAIVDRLGLGRFALLGHSMGGATAYVYADRHPRRLSALLIEDIAPGSSTAGAGAQRILTEMASLPEGFANWAEARRYWRARRPSIGVSALEQRVAESLREGSDGSITWRYDARGIRRTRMHPDPARVIDLWPLMRRLQVPTLIIRGEKSDFCPLDAVERMRKLNPIISYETVANASHYVHDDALMPFAEHVRQFLTHCGWQRSAATQSN
ncbi:MAG TPA: alpha/beta hydrolase [Steroidobacteraceae bacterium]